MESPKDAEDVPPANLGAESVKPVPETKKPKRGATEGLSVLETHTSLMSRTSAIKNDKERKSLMKLVLLQKELSYTKVQSLQMTLEMMLRLGFLP